MYGVSGRNRWTNPGKGSRSNMGGCQGAGKQIEEMVLFASILFFLEIYNEKGTNKPRRFLFPPCIRPIK
jgi:hypothetical protein